MSARLDSFVCQNTEFSELFLGHGVSMDEMYGNAEHSALVEDSPWTALAAARTYKFMRDEGAYLAVDNGMFAYRNARSNGSHTFAVSKLSATWFNADTEDQLPAAQVIFGMLTDNRIAVAIKAFNNVADAQDALLMSADTSFRF